MKAIDLEGKVFGKWTVVSRAKKGNRLAWFCRCECGEERNLIGFALTSGHSKSCGCYDHTGENGSNYKHGKTGGPEYNSWSSMIQRCTNKSYHNYKFYGGRGITVCDEWKNSFEKFYSDMGERPDDTTLDRIRNHEGYSKDNCRWATHAEQCANRREKCTSIIFTVEGFTGTAASIARHFDIPHHTLSKRMKKSKCDAEFAIKYIRAFRDLNGVHGKKKLPDDWLVSG